MNNYRENYNSEYMSPYDEDEISLIELIKIIIKRWKWAVGVFIFFMVSGIGGTFLYNSGRGIPMEYVSIYQAAKDSNLKPLIPLKSTLEKANLYYKDKVVENYLKEKNISALPFEISISVSEPSGAVIIKSSSMKDDLQKINMIEDVHKKLIETLLSEDSDFFNYKKEAMERNFKKAKQAFELLKNAPTYNAAELAVDYMEEITELENGLSGLESGEILKLVSENKLPEKKTRLILVLIAFSSFFMALITPFFVEFGANLRQSLREDKEKK